MERPKSLPTSMSPADDRSTAGIPPTPPLQQAPSFSNPSSKPTLTSLGLGWVDHLIAGAVPAVGQFGGRMRSTCAGDAGAGSFECASTANCQRFDRNAWDGQCAVVVVGERRPRHLRTCRGVRCGQRAAHFAIHQAATRCEEHPYKLARLRLSCRNSDRQSECQLRTISRLHDGTSPQSL